MKRRLEFAALAVLALVVPAAPCANAADAEDGPIGVLQSDKTPAEKAAACRTLKTAGTAKSVPALAALLPDKDLSHWARIALETMPCPEAGAALREALPKAAGVTVAGICDSIGERRDRDAVPALAGLAKSEDAQIASSAATALGKIGGADAVAALKAAQGKAPAAAQPAVIDALLLCADQFRAADDKKTAAALYKETYELDAPEHAKTAAYRGLVLASDDQAVALIAKALTGDQRAAQRAALPLVREIKGEGATKEFAALVAKVPLATQVALIEGLRQRGDPAAAPSIAGMLKSESQPVRVAAIEALGALGDASIAPVLAEAAAKATGPEQDTARECLNQLRDPKTRDALLERLPKAPPAAQAEMVRALGYRKETQAVPALLKMAQEGDETTRLVAIKSLGMLADGSAAGDITKLLLQAKTDAERDTAEQALSAVSGRGEKPEACAAQVLAAMKDAAVPARVALLRAAGRIGGPDALQALRAGLQDKEAAVQDAALRTMAECGGLEAAPDLLKLAKGGAGAAPAETTLPQRVLALRGYWRLVAASAGRPAEERVKMCEAGMAAASRPEEKKLGLTELGKIAHASALKLAQTLCADDAIRGEAEAACVQIAVGLGGSQPAEAKAALQKIAADAKNDALRAEAKKALDGMDQYVGYITTWLAAGPYRQEGKQCKQLFDIPFPPEPGVAGAAPAAGEVKWQPAPRPADAALFWQADLLPICGGEQCVVYMKTRVFSPKEQKVKLEIGSDDGVKVWVNGKVVHANNVERGLKAGDDKAEAVLKEGWNDFLLKITQNIMGCGACVRIRNLEGSVAEGLRFDTGEAR
ncbi:MAG: HEAT repeat domain-containing protein [Planctomycetota bacterium]|nr:HEAT repeat domain-containing protein [Planctomycetota bacterium]